MTATPTHNINLMPESYRRSRWLGVAIRRWVAVTSAYGLVIALLWGIYSMTGGREYSGLLNERNELESRAAKSKETLNGTRRELASAIQRRQVALGLRQRPDWSILLGVLGEAVGKEVTLREILLSEPIAGPAGTSATVDHRPIELRIFGTDRFAVTIRGIAITQQAASQFTLRIQRLGLFDNVTMTRSTRETYGRINGIGFELQCSLEGQEK